MRTIAVLPFDNQTAVPDLQRELFESLRSTLQRRLNLRDASESRADAIVRGAIVSYDADGEVELIEVPHAGTVEHEATLGGIQLTGRALDDVRASLEEAGHTGRTSDIGYDFDTGFSIFSMGSIMVAEVDPSAAQDDERLVVEGVAVADPAYFGF